MAGPSSPSGSQSGSASGGASPGASGGVIEIFNRMSGPLELVEKAMHEQLGSVADILSALGDHVLSSGGKRMRPLLVLLSAELTGYTGPRRVQIAAAIELLHTATLLHDDVVDLSNLRRGKPSANAIWGNRRAVLAGDFFLARASSMIIDDGSIEILDVFGDTLRALSEGELLQLQHSFDSTVTEARYYQVIERKSAALLSASCELGSILSGVTRAERRCLSEYGRELGLAFQLRDDALDYEADVATLGKRRYADLLEGKVTLPLLMTLKRATVGEREQIVSVLKSAARVADRTLAGEEIEPPDLTHVVELVEKYRGVPDAIRRADEHVARAHSAIAAFPDGEAARALRAAADYAVGRDR